MFLGVLLPPIFHLLHVGGYVRILGRFFNRSSQVLFAKSQGLQSGVINIIHNHQGGDGGDLPNDYSDLFI